ncbi:MAG: hypothetical protein JO025_18985 [Verrucomicrobia bacterium]|nr:hypothetical protein [Verrucomicrobiota bacterium]
MKQLRYLMTRSLAALALAAVSAEASPKADDYADVYHVVGVPNYLEVDRNPNERSQILTRIPRDGKDITGYPGETKVVNREIWMRIEWQGVTGYVKKRYLKEGE